MKHFTETIEITSDYNPVCVEGLQSAQQSFTGLPSAGFRTPAMNRPFSSYWQPQPLYASHPSAAVMAFSLPKGLSYFVILNRLELSYRFQTWYGYLHSN